MYLPVLPRRQPLRRRERVHVPFPLATVVKALPAVARRSPAEPPADQQRAAESDEAAVRPQRPVVCVLVGFRWVGGARAVRRSPRQRRLGRVLRRAQHGGHVERPDLAGVVGFWGCGGGAP